jgi:AraC family transcriptional regulator
VTFAINPRTLSLRSPNAILTGRARRHEVDAFDGPLSIKSVVRGSAVWSTSEGRHRLSPTSLLVLNHGQRYSLLIDSPTEVETFCLFFARDFLPAAARALTAGDAALLDDPDAPVATLGFPETVQPGGAVLPLVRALHRRLRDDAAAVDSAFYDIARAMLVDRADVRRALERLPSRRAATRLELHRRLQRARALADESRAPLTVAELAAVACLSPHHFQRLFTSLFGETPHRYAVRKRLERAALALRTGDDPVIDAARAFGFHSLGSFASLFRRRFGAPPAAWRKKHD